MLDWTPDLTVNNPELDRQHVELFRRLHQASDALDGGAPLAVDLAIAEFADTFVEHVAAEETAMDEALYPDRIRHKAAHELFMADFLRFREELRTHGPTEEAAEWIRTRIPEWLSFHIRVNDAPLAAYLARRTPNPTEVRRPGGETKRFS